MPLLDGREKKPFCLHPQSLPFKIFFLAPLKMNLFYLFIYLGKEEAGGGAVGKGERESPRLGG